VPATCGDFLCDGVDECVECPFDCDGIHNQHARCIFCCGHPGCGEGLCLTNDCNPEMMCGNGNCDNQCSESSLSCPRDCPDGPALRDGICEPGETPRNSPEDCCSEISMCGNGECAVACGESAQTCPADCL
jgi:hypothetical protein